MWSMTAIFNKLSTNIAMNMTHWIGSHRLLCAIVPLLPIEESLKAKDSLSMPNANCGCHERRRRQRRDPRGKKKINPTLTFLYSLCLLLMCVRVQSFIYFWSIFPHLNASWIRLFPSLPFVFTFISRRKQVLVIWKIRICLPGLHTCVSWLITVK